MHNTLIIEHVIARFLRPSFSSSRLSPTTLPLDQAALRSALTPPLDIDKRLIVRRRYRSMRSRIRSLKENFASREIDFCDATEITWWCHGFWARSVSADSYSPTVVANFRERLIIYYGFINIYRIVNRINHNRKSRIANHMHCKSCAVRTTCILLPSWKIIISLLVQTIEEFIFRSESCDLPRAIAHTY